MDTKDTVSSSPPLPSKDGSQAQKSSDHLRKNGTPKVAHKWTGFQGKTLWDWLQLLGVLAIPLVVVGATIAFGIQQANLANQQHEADQQLALDQQRQATLVAYLDNMKDLLLNRGLIISRSGDEVRVIAHTETLSAMRQLDGKRNDLLIQFLQDAHLIGFQSGNIVSFELADLRSTDLSFAFLYGVDLSEALLIGANLNFADLNGANLSYAFLEDATLRGATLSGANLSGAYNLTQQQLDQVQSCKGAILPKGLTCHHNL